MADDKLHVLNEDKVLEVKNLLLTAAMAIELCKKDDEAMTSEAAEAVSDVLWRAILICRTVVGADA